MYTHIMHSKKMKLPLNLCNSTHVNIFISLNHTHAFPHKTIAFKA